MAKKTDTTVAVDYVEIGRAVVLLASLFQGASPIAVTNGPQPSTTSTPASQPDEKNAPADTTPDQAKAEPADEGKALLAAMTAEPVNHDLSTADNYRAVAPLVTDVKDFSKLGMRFAKKLNDNGEKAKAIWKNYTQADGTSPVQKFSDTTPADFAKQLGEMADALAEAEMA